LFRYSGVTEYKGSIDYQSVCSLVKCQGISLFND
jgi:hypothetical protein